MKKGYQVKRIFRWKEDNLRCYPSVFRDDLTIEADVFTSPKSTYPDTFDSREFII